MECVTEFVNILLGNESITILTTVMRNCSKFACQ